MARIIGWIPKPEADKVSPIEVAVSPTSAPATKGGSKKTKGAPAPKVDGSVGDDGGVPLGDPRA